jgi:hypothetical protein
MIADFYFWWVPVMAQAAPAAADPSISATQVGAIIAAIITALVGGGFLGKKAAEATKTTLEGQPIGVKVRKDFVTYDVLDGHLDRIEGNFEEIKEALDGERGIARTANGNLHKRIDALSERLGDRLSKLEGTTEGIAKTTDALLDIALHGKKPPTRGH